MASTPKPLPSFCAIEESGVSVVRPPMNTPIMNTTIEISFRDNKVEVWETKPAMTPVDLMSRIGGTMGLYLGISIVTVFEVTKLLANVCGLCFTKPERIQD